MSTGHKVNSRILLKPVWHQDPPKIRISAGQEVCNITLDNDQWVEFDFETANIQETICVEFLNKRDSDTIIDQNLDKAVIVEFVEFFDIQDPKFVWAGIYEPVYPEPWATQQQMSGTVLPKQLSSHNYLSWNGKWTLTFDVPVFTWIHKIQNLGWIYK